MMNNINDFPIAHGLSLPQILQILGNHILYIQSLEMQINRLLESKKMVEEELAKMKEPNG